MNQPQQEPNSGEPIQIGVAGEYLAAGELSLRGRFSSITLRNSRRIDIIASNPEVPNPFLFK